MTLLSSEGKGEKMMVTGTMVRHSQSVSLHTYIHSTDPLCHKDSRI